MKSKTVFGMARSFKYCVLRFRPDIRRDESVNIGVVVFNGDFIDVHLAESFGKAQALVPGVSLASLSTLRDQIRSTISTLGSVESKHAALQRFGPITASVLGELVLGRDDEYEHAVARLLVDFVLPPRGHLKIKAAPGQLRKSVKHVFSRSGMLAIGTESIYDHKVVCEYPVAEAEKLFADFAFKNGVYRFAQVVDMNTSSSNLNSRFKDCCEKALALDKAKQQFGSDSQRLVLFSAPSEHSPIVDAALNLLSDYSSLMLNADNTNDMEKFLGSFTSPDLASITVGA
jgi:hypothetical protein